VTDFLDEKRREITDRLKELKPMVDEYNRLEAAASALQSVGGASPAGATAAPRRRGPGRPRGSVNRTTAKAAAVKPKRKPGRPAARRRAGRRKGSGTRAAEAFAFVQGQPGITIPELAAKMGIKQNYLYRVLPGLQQEGKVSKKGRGWQPKS
jgi:phage tail tape-measure protein